MSKLNKSMLYPLKCDINNLKKSCDSYRNLLKLIEEQPKDIETRKKIAQDVFDVFAEIVKYLMKIADKSNEYYYEISAILKRKISPSLFNEKTINKYIYSMNTYIECYDYVYEIACKFKMSFEDNENIDNVFCCAADIEKEFPKWLTYAYNRLEDVEQFIINDISIKEHIIMIINKMLINVAEGADKLIQTAEYGRDLVNERNQGMLSIDTEDEKMKLEEIIRARKAK
jgi:hypothetical protein